MRTIDEAIAAYEAGESWLDDDEVVNVEAKQPLDKVIPIRLTGQQWTLIREEARKRGLGPSTLSRMWLLEKLAESQPRPPLGGPASRPNGKHGAIGQHGSISERVAAKSSKAAPGRAARTANPVDPARARRQRTSPRRKVSEA